MSTHELIIGLLGLDVLVVLHGSALPSWARAGTSLAASCALALLPGWAIYSGAWAAAVGSAVVFAVWAAHAAREMWSAISDG